MHSNLPFYRIDPILRPVVYCTAIAHASNNFEFALTRFLEATGTPKTQLLTALGCSRSSSAVSQYFFLQNILTQTTSFSQNYLRMLILYQTRLLGAADGSSTGISKQFALGALQSLAANHLHRGTLSSFLNDSIRKVVEYYGDATIVANTIKSLSSYFSSAQDLAFVNIQHLTFPLFYAQVI